MTHEHCKFVQGVLTFHLQEMYVHLKINLSFYNLTKKYCTWTYLHDSRDINLKKLQHVPFLVAKIKSKIATKTGRNDRDNVVMLWCHCFKIKTHSFDEPQISLLHSFFFKLFRWVWHITRKKIRLETRLSV